MFRGAGILAACLSLAGCPRPGPAKGADKQPAAKLERVSRESELAKVVLEPEAVARLGIAEGLATVERARVPVRRSLAGEVLPVPGRTVQLVAPVTATVTAVSSQLAPGAAAPAGSGLRLRPFLGPAERLQVLASLADAEGQVAKARVQLEAQGLVVQRTERLVRDQTAAARALEEARARLEEARAELRAAEGRRDVVAQTAASFEGDLEGRAPDVAVNVPFEAVILRLHVAVGEVVPAGKLLAEVADLGRAWVRVPVAVPELAELDPAAEASIAKLAATAAATSAMPVAPMPRQFDGLAGTGDLFYELENDGRSFFPGERVSVSIPVRGAGEERLVVPWAAVLHDAHGGAWVYENVEPGVFVRRRVEVLRVEGGRAVLARGARLVAGARVVGAGAAELFGVEFVTGK